METVLEIYRPIIKRSFDKLPMASIGLEDMKSDDNRDYKLFRDFTLGNQEAFVALYKYHNQKLFHFCAKITADTPAAEDIAQNVWVKLIELRSSLDDISNPIGFLYRIARNLCYDHIKHKRFQISLEELTSDGHPQSSDTSLSVEEEVVLQELDLLPTEIKEVLILHYYSGYSFEEIAQQYSKKTNAIWTKVSRARKELKQRVEKRLMIERRIVNEN